MLVVKGLKIKKNNWWVLQIILRVNLTACLEQTLFLGVPVWCFKMRLAFESVGE